MVRLSLNRPTLLGGKVGSNTRRSEIAVESMAVPHRTRKGASPMKKKLSVPLAILVALLLLLVSTLIPATTVACVVDTVTTVDHSPPVSSTTPVVSCSLDQYTIGPLNSINRAGPTTLAGIANSNAAIVSVSEQLASYDCYVVNGPSRAPTLTSGNIYSATDYHYGGYLSCYEGVLTAGLDWYANVGFSWTFGTSYMSSMTTLPNSYERRDHDMRDRTAAIASAVACSTRHMINPMSVPASTV